MTLCILMRMILWNKIFKRAIWYNRNTLTSTFYTQKRFPTYLLPLLKTVATSYMVNVFKFDYILVKHKKPVNNGVFVAFTVLPLSSN